jgi:hypothetical protein
VNIASITIACTVCYGDPASPLTKGAQAGVVVLGLAIFGVLVGFASLFVFWMRRAKALERELAAARDNAERIDVPVSPEPSLTHEPDAPSAPLGMH